jgi:tRNA nucleotidyltransferase/poly(A) polymerase
MSDYMFMLESHLSPEQSAVLSAVQSAAADSNVSLFLTGGAMRDMLGGFPVRDLDFTVEGNALKLAKDLVKKAGARIVSEDEHKKSAEISFPNGGRCEVAMARTEKFGKPGVPPSVKPAIIHEDLRGRDFTINAIGLSLNRASRGLLIDPTNGLSDLERKELRAISNYSMYDDPLRMLRLIRLKARLGFTVDERTMNQLRNAREAEMEQYITPRALLHELRQICLEPSPFEVLKAMEEEKLLDLFVPGLTSAKLNPAGFQKLAKAKSMIPFGASFPVDWYAITMWCFTQLMTPKEKASLLKSTKMLKADTEPWDKLELRAKKLETALKSARLTRASQIFEAINKAPGEETLLLFLKSPQKLVQDRIKNHFTKYLVTALDVTDAEVSEATGLQPSDAKFAKAKYERTLGRLDGRIRKPAPPPEPPPPPQPSPRTAGRGIRLR